MNGKTERFKSAQDFGRSIGLSNLEMVMIHEKKKLIERLKSSRIQKGLSQSEVARLVGTKQPAIARMEAGQVSQVSMDFLLRAALVLGLTVTIRPMKDAA